MRGEAGDLLVDGGLLNNMPADVMAVLGDGYRIAVDVGPHEELATDDYADPASGWLGLRLLGSSLLPIGRRPRMPTIFNILYSSILVASRSLSERLKDEVDLYMNPPVESVGTFEWGALDRLVEVGEEHARTRLAGWAGVAAIRAGEAHAPPAPIMRNGVARRVRRQASA